jgi:hypothetical protein
MTEEKNEKAKKEESPIPEGMENNTPTPQERQLIIMTDGMRVRVDPKSQVSPLEIKEICRELLKQFGG